MRQVRRTAQFKKDVKRMQKRGKGFGQFRAVISKIVNTVALDKKYHDHPLLGTYKGYRECHIESNWLLIYKRTQTEVILIRTGTHGDLFG